MIENKIGRTRVMYRLVGDPPGTACNLIGDDPDNGADPLCQILAEGRYRAEEIAETWRERCVAHDLDEARAFGLDGFGETWERI